MEPKDKIRILVVDDDPYFLRGISRMLKSEGYEVVAASTGEDCLRKLEKEKVDLVLLDIMMPGMSGWDVFNRINKKTKEIRVAFMSVLEISNKRKQVLLEEGLADYIMKTFDKDSLLDRVDKILREKEENE